MPKGLNLKFGRRKSSANALDFEDGAAPPPQPAAPSTFRVLERSDKKSTPYGSDKNISRPFNSPLNVLRGKSADDLGLGPNRAVNKSTRNQSGWPLNGARGSGGTTNSGSSGYYESSGASARHSSTSTLPSSLDQDRSPDDEELFPHPRKSATTGMYHSVAVNADDLPPPPPSFTSRAARAFSFGNKHGRPTSKDIPDVPPLPPLHANGTAINPTRSYSPQRERAMTNSSYASTAVPSKTELTLGNPDFGTDDFGNMFDSLKREDPAAPPVGSFHRTESEPMYPPRTLSRNALTPSPNPYKMSRDDSNSPYSWDDGSSNDGLVNNSALSSPGLPDGGPSGPAVGNGITQAFLGNSKSGYSRVPERYTSPGPEQERIFIGGVSGLMADYGSDKEHVYPNRQVQVDDEDRWTRKVELREGPHPRLSTMNSPNRLAPSIKGKQAISNPSSVRAGAISPSSAGESVVESNTPTPRATRNLQPLSEDVMFKSPPIGPASRTVRPGPSHQRPESSTIKKMTKAQFNALKRQSESSAEQSEEEDLSGDDYDDEDDVERARRMASQRQKQEANMSVYRQQMKKVTGGGPTDLPPSAASTVRPFVDRSSTAPSVIGSGGLHFGGIGSAPPELTFRARQSDDDDDDDVPLGILQAHGFPTNSRPPTQTGENDLAHQRRTSVAGSAVGGGAGQGNLPPFARRLPADPYFGAGLVNQSTRESLALNNSSAVSVMGMPPSAPPQMPQPSQMGHPGGLVGVIAGEERARAARRGSPNAAAMMGNMPLPSNMNMPQMPRTMSMGNVMPPQVYNPSGAPPMPAMPMGMGLGMPGMMPMQMPQDASQQQMQQFMQMQMQFMQNMLTMQAQLGQVGPQTPQAQMLPQQQQTGDYLGVNFGSPSRPVSIASQATNQQYMQQSNQSQGRSMTMMNPPTGWGSAANPGGPRPNSAMPLVGGYAPSVQGLNISGGAGPGPGYTPSIAPSERSNIGMPSRYRPVAQNGDATRTHSMTSNLTLQPFQRQQSSPNLPGTPFNGTQSETPKSTIRILDKPKGAPKVTSRPIDEDDEDGWTEMKKKRDEKKRSKWSLRKDKTTNSTTNEPALSDLYTNLD